MKLFVRSLFILVLAGFSCSNAAAWLHGHMPLLDQTDALEVLIEQEEESHEDSGSLDERLNTDAGNGPGPVLFPLEAFYYPRLALSLSPCHAAAVRQFLVNLLNSFRTPALFILFNTYQGYLS